MTMAPAQDEIDGGGPVLPTDHGGGIDAFALPAPQEGIAAHILAHCRDIADAGTMPRRGDGGVGGITPKAFEIEPAALGIGGQLAVFQHGLSHAEQIDAHGRATAAAPMAETTERAAAWIASRLPAS